MARPAPGNDGCGCAEAGFSPRRRPALILTALLLALMLGAAIYGRGGRPSPEADSAARPTAPAVSAPAAGATDEDRAALMGLMRRLKENPRHVPTLTALAERFMDMGSWEDARLFLNRALVAEPGSARAMRLLGACLAEIGDAAGAAEQYRSALALDENDAESRLKLGLLCKCALDRPGEARSHFQALLTLTGADAETRERARLELGGRGAAGPAAAPAAPSGKSE